MDELKGRILKEGHVISSEILNVDSFINHQVDPEFMEKVGIEIAEHFKDKGITKVATIESSGIAPALFTAKALSVPLIILKKQASKILNENLYQTEVTSFTTKKSYELSLSGKFVTENDHVLIVDDFLADGEAAIGALRLIRKAHGTVAGVGAMIDKSFQPGADKLREQGIDVYSLAVIKSLENSEIIFE